jgi:nucleoid DNA-binding protein
LYTQLCARRLYDNYKADLSLKIANDYEFVKSDAAEVMEKLLDIIQDDLISGEDVIMRRISGW